MLKYYRISKENKDEQEISKEKALDILLGSYKDSDMTRDFLEIPNWIPCMFSYIAVRDVTKDGVMVPMAGLQCLVPDGIEYNDDCMRVK